VLQRFSAERAVKKDEERIRNKRKITKQTKTPALLSVSFNFVCFVLSSNLQSPHIRVKVAVICTLRLTHEAGSYDFVKKLRFGYAAHCNPLKIAVINAPFGESSVRFQNIISPRLSDHRVKDDQEFTRA
jgi:hypothetical protein